ncbi:MAG: SMC-Scp complex subunit ScpB [Sulfuriferula sp.]|nr:SMC-Scp complex subunit ScpB [Sulfuriferula sp.]
MKHAELKNILEVMLFAHGEPLTINEMRTALAGDLSAELIYRALNELRDEWAHKGLALVVVADGWRFQTRAEYQVYLQRLSPERPPKYSRAVMETLAVIAYKQPVTRGDIEEIRGVTINTQIIKTLEQREWIKTVGHREVPGRPALYVTTPQFLSDLNLRALAELPPLAELGQLVAPNPYTLDLELVSDAAE